MSGVWRAFRSAVGYLVGVIKEFNYWQRRMMLLSQAPDRYVLRPNRAPDTFDEFMARTSGPLLREPSARARLGGRRVG